MTSAELLIEKGVMQGIIQEKQNSVIRLSQHKFNEVPDSFTNKVRQINDLVQLDSLFEEVLKSSRLDDVTL